MALSDTKKPHETESCSLVLLRAVLHHMSVLHLFADCCFAKEAVEHVIEAELVTVVGNGCPAASEVEDNALEMMKLRENYICQYVGFLVSEAGSAAEIHKIAVVAAAAAAISVVLN